MSAFYGLFKDALGAGSIDLLTDNIKACAVDLADYTPNMATDAFLDDIPVAAIVSTAPNLASKTLTLGVFNAAPSTLPSVTGDQFEAVVIYKDTGVGATSQLICILDTGTGLPFTPSGGNVVITWDTGANKVLVL